MPYICKKCQKGFSLRKDARKHVKDVHHVKSNKHDYSGEGKKVYKSPITEAIQYQGWKKWD